MRGLAHVALLVDDYDRALAWYTGALGFRTVADTPLGGGKRWVLVEPPGGGGASLLLARAEGEEQRARVGDQAGGRVFLFLFTDDFARDHAGFTARGVRFLEQPRQESYGTVAVFQDLYGNKWDLLEPVRPEGPSASPEGGKGRQPTATGQSETPSSA